VSESQSDSEAAAQGAGERRAARLAAAWLFCWFTALFVQRPLRDDFGIAQGVENLPFLMGITALVVLPANLVFSSLAGRFAAARFVPWMARTFVLILVVFAALLHHYGRGDGETQLARGFYVWMSLYNLFAVSLFWGTMAELFASERAKRWYGLLSAGGTAGALFGSALVKGAVTVLPGLGIAGTDLTIVLLVVAALVIEAGTRCQQAVTRLPFAHALVESPAGTPAENPALTGMRRCLRSPYLLGICAFLALYTLTSTAIYLGKQSIVDVAFDDDRDGRKEFFADIDLVTQGLTLFGQLLITATFLRRLGVTFGLAFVPVITIVGFVIVGFEPTLLAVVAFEVVRRVAEYVVTRPSRELLFTVVPREDKYPAKMFIDTFVYRLGDALGSGFTAITQRGSLGPEATFFAAAPVAAVWLVVGIVLGRRQTARARDLEVAPAPAPVRR
jgi:AAA family ATP:ADP antiporter